MKKFYPLLIIIAITFLVAYVGSLFTNIGLPVWYVSLNKPSFNPPNWIFGPVWTVLYLMMSVSAFLIWKKRNDSGSALACVYLYFTHLVFNLLWSLMFFGLQSTVLGLLFIILLWLIIAAMAYAFYKIDKFASYLLIPYILWVSFASILNYAIWSLN